MSDIEFKDLRGMSEASRFIVTMRNATLDARSADEMTILAASAFDVEAGGVGFGLEEIKNITGLDRGSILTITEKLKNRGELHSMGFLFYGTPQGLKAWLKITAI